MPTPATSRSTARLMATSPWRLHVDPGSYAFIRNRHHRDDRRLDRPELLGNGQQLHPGQQRYRRQRHQQHVFDRRTPSDRRRLFREHRARSPRVSSEARPLSKPTATSSSAARSPAISRSAMAASLKPTAATSRSPARSGATLLARRFGPLRFVCQLYRSGYIVYRSNNVLISAPITGGFSLAEGTFISADGGDLTIGAIGGDFANSGEPPGDRRNDHL